jgi:hypothetical protein
VVGIVFLAVFALVGFVIGKFKIPTIAGLTFTKKVGDESIDDVILRYFKFRKNKSIYIYTKEEK